MNNLSFNIISLIDYNNSKISELSNIYKILSLKKYNFNIMDLEFIKYIKNINDNNLSFSNSSSQYDLVQNSANIPILYDKSNSFDSYNSNNSNNSNNQSNSYDSLDSYDNYDNYDISNSYDSKISFISDNSNYNNLHNIIDNQLYNIISKDYTKFTKYYNLLYKIEFTNIKLFNILQDNLILINLESINTSFNELLKLNKI
jgi:hypothetical protein